MTRATRYTLAVGLTLAAIFVHLYVTAWMWDAGDYFYWVVVEGDPENDFLTHAPERMQPMVHALGQALDALLMAAGLVS